VSRKKKPATRPRYETYGVARSVIEQNFIWSITERGVVLKRGEAEELGLATPFLMKAESLRHACHQMHFFADPKSSWHNLAFELEIIRSQLPEDRTEGCLSRSQMAKLCDDYADQIGNIADGLSGLAGQDDFAIAAIESKGGLKGDDAFEYANFPFRLSEFIVPLKRLAQFLEKSKQSHKWKQFSQRERRLVLACKLLPVFEEEFGTKASVKGGSTRHPIDEETPWVQFFQAVASLLLDEKATPDRQAILREVFLPTE